MEKYILKKILNAFLFVFNLFLKNFYLAIFIYIVSFTFLRIQLQKVRNNFDKKNEKLLIIENKIFKMESRKIEYLASYPIVDVKMPKETLESDN